MLGRYIFQVRGGQVSLQPAFDSLAGPTITQGTTPETLGGHIIAGSAIPPGNVSITLNGVTQTAAIDPTTGNFSSVFDTSGLTASGSPYQITYSYPGGTNTTTNTVFSAISDTSHSLTVLPVPAVTSVKVDIGTAQRSMVRSLDVTFNQQVTLDANAFSLTLPSGVVSPVNLSWTTSVVAGDTVAHITFAGAGINASGSLQDGHYTLNVLDTAVHNVTNATMAQNYNYHFFRFFGDSNGDGRVDAVDYAAFRTAYLSGNATGANSIYDYNGDGVFTTADLQAFTYNFTKRQLTN